jgi:hypothetical protein
MASKLGVGASVATGARTTMHNGFSLSSHLVPFLIGSKYIRLRNLFFYDPLVLLGPVPDPAEGSSEALAEVSQLVLDS